MSETATILIPDISGYTEYLSRTDLDHSAGIINHLLDRIVQSMDPSYVVSEIEGDAVLLYRKGAPVSKREIIEQCIKTFNIFQSDIHDIKKIVICQCSACQNVTDLTLKFVVHYGNIAEINVNRFTKASGIDMVIAHRLLKNSIPVHDYILTTSSYLNHVADREETHDLQWTESSEDYPSIGIVEYRFASLAHGKISSSILREEKISIAASAGISTVVEIDVPYKEVLEAIINMEKRKQYVEGLTEGEGPPRLLMGTRYSYVFPKGNAEIEPKQVQARENEVMYEEYATAPAFGLHAAYQFHLEALDSNRTRLTWTVFPQPNHTFSDEMKNWISEKIDITAKRFKTFCEKDFESASTIASLI